MLRLSVAADMQQYEGVTVHEEHVSDGGPAPGHPLGSCWAAAGLILTQHPARPWRACECDTLASMLTYTLGWLVKL